MYLTHCRSIGVVVYVILSGVSPFLDDSLDETCSNIVRRDFCFPHEYFSGISGDAKDFISMLLVFDIGQVSSLRYSVFCSARHLLLVASYWITLIMYY